MVRIFGFLFFLLFGSQLLATHNLAGDITYKHISGLTYEITVTIFSDGNSTAVSRKQIEIDWGDQTGLDSLTVLQEIPIGSGENFVLKRVWKALHTYPGGAFTYTIRVVDPNRNANIVNIDGSVNVPFTIETQIGILPVVGQENNSIQLRNDPLDSACAGALFIYNPGAFDPDGRDSIAYRIAKSKGFAGGIAPGYRFPPASDSLVVDPITGDLIWRTPTNIGLFNIAILIIEYRNGVRIGSVLRDIQINVRGGCNNNPPTIFSDDQVCVEAGTGLSFNITATDPDNDKVTLSATGEVLEPPILSRTTFNSGTPNNPTNATFTWNTNCTDVRKNTYKLSLKAEDDAITRNSTNLVNFKTVNIRVVSPAPENATATASGKTIILNWDNLKCSSASGYYIYRRLDSSGFTPSTCIIGVPNGIGYQKIATIENVNTTVFADDNNGIGLVPGQKYCYLITKYFTDGDESYASNETCAEIDKIVPVITKVSIDSTNTTTGIVQLQWSPPSTFDQTAFPPPYRYLIQKFDSANSGFSPVDSTNSIEDTTFTDQVLNTLTSQHSYRIDLLSLGSGRNLVGISPPASSVFLSISATDERLNLNWKVDVPWLNSSYVIYRKKEGQVGFDSLTTTFALEYSDTSLINGDEYCYYIQSLGAYNLNSVPNPIVNFSQQVCATPVDNIPPCAPKLTLNADCNQGTLALNWMVNFNTCAMDASGYILYKALTLNGPLVQIERFNSLNDTNYFSNNDSVGGCYAVAVVDSAGNVSSLSNKICTDFCPIYELPNVFTPNGDGTNDLFIPIPPYKYVDSINMIIYNRWGEVVFETQDPDIKWDGSHQNIKSREFNDFANQSSPHSSDGVYYYICEVYELSLSPNEPRILKGTITILNKNQTLED